MTINLYYSCDLFLMFWLLIRFKKRKRERRRKKKKEERNRKKGGKRQNDFFRLSATGWTELNREIKSNVRG